MRTGYGDATAAAVVRVRPTVLVVAASACHRDLRSNWSIILSHKQRDESSQFIESASGWRRATMNCCGGKDKEIEEMPEDPEPAGCSWAEDCCPVEKVSSDGDHLTLKFGDGKMAIIVCTGIG